MATTIVRRWGKVRRRKVRSEYPARSKAMMSRLTAVESLAANN